MTRSNAARYALICIIITALLALLAAQIIMPRMQKAFELRSAYSCESSSLPFVNLQSSTCASGMEPNNAVGFPLVTNGLEYTALQAILASIFNALPFAVGIAILYLVLKRTEH